MITQINAIVLSGTHAERPSPSTVPTVNTIYRETDTGAAFILLQVAGVKTWVTFASSGSLGLPQYFVNQAGQLPVTQFQTISSAIAQAIADGHTSSANPTKIVVYAGTYTENVNIPDGISVVTLGQDDGQTVNIVGNVQFTGGVASKSALSGVTVTGQIQINTNDPIAGTVDLEDVQVTNSAGDAVNCGGTGAIVNVNNCSFNTSAGAPSAAFNTGKSVVTLLAFSSSFSGFGANSSLFIGSGAPFLTVIGCTLLGPVFANGTGVINVIGCKTTVNAATAFAPTAAGASINVFGGTAQGTFTSLAGGVGTVAINNLQCLNGVVKYSSNTVLPPSQASQATARQYNKTSLALGGGTTVPSGFDEVFFTTSAGAAATLPDVKTLPLGTRIVVKTDGGNAVTLTASGGQNIDGVGTQTIPVQATPLPSLTVQSDPANSRWDVIAKT